MLIAIIDFETTGLDAKTGHPVEVAAATYSVDHGCLAEVRSWLFLAPAAAVESTRKIHGIPGALVDPDDGERGGAPGEVWIALKDFLDGSVIGSAILAHNAEFDRSWCPPEIQSLLWVCTKNDIEWPRADGPGLPLVSLAVLHGVAVARAHRAIDDVLTIAALLSRVQEQGADLRAMLARAMRPKVRVVSLAPFEENHVVKAHRFQWDPVGRVWWRSMAREDVAALPFRTKEVAA